MKYQILKAGLEDIRHLLRDRIKVDEEVVDYMSLKAVAFPIWVKCVPTPIALILKQEMLSIGADAAIPSTSVSKRNECEDILLLGSLHHYKKLNNKLKWQVMGLSDLGEQILSSSEHFAAAYYRKTDIMGVLNLTPDSFYDGGESTSVEKMKEKVLEIEKSADIIDIGAESSRPGSAPVSAQDQIARLTPFFEIKKRFEIPVSLDTRDHEVFRHFKDRIDILNDISGVSDPATAELLGETEHDVVIMHMKGTPEDMQDKPEYDDVIDEILNYFEQKLLFFEKLNVRASRIILDPGIGFGKKYEDNIRILKQIDAFKQFGSRIMIGHSNKSFMKDIYKEKYEEKRELGTLGIAAYLFMKKIDIIRVHDTFSVRSIFQALNALDK